MSGAADMASVWFTGLSFVDSPVFACDSSVSLLSLLAPCIVMPNLVTGHYSERL